MSAANYQAMQAEKPGLEKEVQTYTDAASKKIGIEGLTPAQTESEAGRLKKRLERINEAIAKTKKVRRKEFSRLARRGPRER